MNGRNAGLMKFHIKLFIKYKNVIAGVDNGIGIQQNIRTVVNPGHISHIRSLAGKRYDRKIIKGKYKVGRTGTDL